MLFFQPAFDVKAQNIAAEADDIAQVVEEVDHAGTHWFGRYFAITACDRGKDVFVCFVVELGNGTVVAFIRVGRIAFGQCGRGGKADEKAEGSGGFFHDCNQSLIS